VFAVGAPPRPGSVGAEIAAPSTSALPLAFRDGTRFEVGSGGKLRVASATSSEVALVLESGALHGWPGKGSRSWRVDAGPYRMVVTGAEIAATYRPEGEVLELKVVSGGPVVVTRDGAQAAEVKSGEGVRLP
jgi:hypothetical protein